MLSSTVALICKRKRINSFKTKSSTLLTSQHKKKNYCTLQDIISLCEYHIAKDGEFI